MGAVFCGRAAACLRLLTTRAARQWLLSQRHLETLSLTRLYSEKKTHSSVSRLCPSMSIDTLAGKVSIYCQYRFGAIFFAIFLEQTTKPCVGWIRFLNETIPTDLPPHHFTSSRRQRGSTLLTETQDSTWGTPWSALAGGGE